MPRMISAPPKNGVPPLTDTDIERLQSLLDAVPAPLEPLDVMALDGYLCGVLLQPTVVGPSKWLPAVFDMEGRAVPPTFDMTEISNLAQRRHTELRAAINNRDWFDPWIFDLDEDASPSEAVLPWVAGFAAAQDHFPALMKIEHPELIEPLALLYLHFDPEDLEDAEALQAVIDTIEPPDSLAEAVQDIVRAIMLIADVATPRPMPKPAPRAEPPRRIARRAAGAGAGSGAAKPAPSRSGRSGR